MGILAIKAHFFENIGHFGYATVLLVLDNGQFDNMVSINREIAESIFVKILDSGNVTHTLLKISDSIILEIFLIRKFLSILQRPLFIIRNNIIKVLIQ